MMKRIRQLTLAIVALTALAVPTIAHASADQVIKDCNDDGALSKKYSKQELQKALHTLPGDVKDYSDCKDVITAALAAAGKKKKSGGGGRGGGAAAPAKKAPAAKPDPGADAAALDHVRRGAKPKLEIGGKPLEPGKNGLFNLSASNGLPTSLLLALVALALVAIGAALITLRKRVPALARIPLPSLSLESLRRVTPPRFRR
jgi:hypothetical protein